MSKKFYVAASIVLAVLLISLLPVRNEALTFHTAEERAHFQKMALMPPPPVDSALIFPKSTACEGCHGFDEAQFAYVTQYGEEVNVFDDWQASMMANSAKDPFWRAKVSHETLLHPAEKEEIETKCTSCHAPMGHYTNILRGAEHYTMEDLLLDSIGLDGVGCGACHQMAASGLGDLNSGAIVYDTTRTIFGPYPGPFDGPMNEFVGYNPVYGPHINDAGLCASCHSLLTETHDLEGNNLGTKFVEQATYHEWLNSFYRDEQSCQHCHLPQLDEEIVISSGYAFLEGRQPFGLHDLVGANTTMLGLMMENKEALEIEASNSDFFQTIEKTYAMLQEQSLDFTLNFDQEAEDSLYFTLELENKAGHKFPSGYPSRRVTVEFVVTEENGDTLFQSGVHEPNFEVKGRNEDFEPHYNIINSEDQVQIYEFVVGDVNGDVTTVLERGAMTLKDNRLAPLGFTTTHEVYDTTRIVGTAELDPNFNLETDGTEGTGKDFLHYHIPLDGYFGAVNVRARVWYQALPPAWMAEMFSESTPEIETFRTMFDGADQSPVMVAQEFLDLPVVGTSSNNNPFTDTEVKVFPNPNAGSFSLKVPENFTVQDVVIRNTAGQIIQSYTREGLAFRGLPQGVYFAEIYGDNSKILQAKILVQ